MGAAAIVGIILSAIEKLVPLYTTLKEQAMRNNEMSPAEQADLVKREQALLASPAWQEVVLPPTATATGFPEAPADDDAPAKIGKKK